MRITHPDLILGFSDELASVARDIHRYEHIVHFVPSEKEYLDNMQKLNELSYEKIQPICNILKGLYEKSSPEDKNLATRVANEDIIGTELSFAKESVARIETISDFLSDSGYPVDEGVSQILDLYEKFIKEFGEIYEQSKERLRSKYDDSNTKTGKAGSKNTKR